MKALQRETLVVAIADAQRELNCATRDSRKLTPDCAYFATNIATQLRVAAAAFERIAKLAEKHEKRTERDIDISAESVETKAHWNEETANYEAAGYYSSDGDNWVNESGQSIPESDYVFNSLTFVFVGGPRNGEKVS